MPVQRHTCHQCNKLIPKEKTFIVLYDASTHYVYYFCSWWHLTKWYVSKWKKEVIDARHSNTISGRG